MMIIAHDESSAKAQLNSRVKASMAASLAGKEADCGTGKQPSARVAKPF
jgi:hypothetical protein